MSTKTKLIYFGNERLVSGLKNVDPIILRGLIERGYDVVAIVSHHNQTRSRNARQLEVAELAEQHNIPLHLPKKPIEIIEILSELKPEIAVLAAYGRIIPQAIIDIFPKGIINLHPSLLPAYRGPTPIESQILNGDTQTGVSIMQLTAGMDDGPVYAQQKIELTGTENKYDIYQTAHSLGAELLFASLPGIINGNLKPTPQDHGLATYSNLLDKSDGILNPETMTALEAERRVRAYLDFPKSKLTVFDQPIIVLSAHTTTGLNKDQLIITFKDQTYLAIDELISPNGKRMSGPAFMRGYQKA